ncbi:YebC/PmpR family DNA-binding transcriptional regulator [Helicobacter sp. 23-1048]
MGRAFEYRRAAKEKRWDKMSKVFPKLAKVITMAAKEGGGDPAMNAKLRTAIANAKAQNMPKDNIDAAIKRASVKDGQFSEVTYEGKASGGVLIFIECTTDNPTRTIANIKSYFNKTQGAQIVPNGSLEFMFARKSVFEFVLPEGSSAEEVELALIDYGLEELERADSSADSESRVDFSGENSAKYAAIGDYSDFGTLSEGFEKLGISVQKASLQRIPTSPISLSEEQTLELEKLLDRIEEDDDVQAVWTNLA